MLGTFVLSSGYRDAYYKKALRVRTEIIGDYNAIFEQCDCLLSPASPTPAWKLGEKRSDPTEMYSADIFTVPVNIAGLPALPLPCGKSSTGLPIGLQLIGPHLSEGLLYRVGHALEQELL